MEFITDASLGEKKLIHIASIQKIPINGSFELTPLCNMDCRMCYVRLSRAEMERRGRLRTAAEWLEIGRQMRDSGVLFLLLTGGEPLTHPEFKAIYLGLREMGMMLTINTNGTLIEESWMYFFEKYPPRRINITLYGASAQTYERLCRRPGGFERTINAVKLLRRKGIDVKLAMSLTPANLRDWEAVHDIGAQLGVPVRMDTYMMPATREREKAFSKRNRLTPVIAAQAQMQALRLEMGEELFKQYAAETLRRIDEEPQRPAEPTPMTCLAGSCSFTINWQGEMRPCVVMDGPAVNVFEHGFAESWRMMRQETDKIRTSPTCAACRLRPLCRTCAASALLEAGSYDAVPEYMCAYAKESERVLREMEAQYGTD